MIKYIAVAGNMGTGKSSLVDFLCGRYRHIRPFFERNEENPYLEDFYRDMGRWAFHSQVYFLTLKFGIHQELDACPDTVIQDRTIFEDAEIFAENLHRRGFLTGRDYAAYRRLYETMLESLDPPDLLVYLRSGLRTIKKRIRLRGRAYEAEVDTGYLKDLNSLYERWIGRYTLSPVLVIDADRLDFMRDLVDRIEVVETIEKHL
ncbi:MAG: deoxynucleoside kinase [Deltaproteobacteria bacterium]|nr:deoxynucleoside kinase [Deltaproteobacteria bacterium]